MIATPFVLHAQTTSTIKGKIVDKETKDPLPAYVHIEGSEIGGSADYEGLFVLDTSGLESQKKLNISIFLIGYKKKTVEAVPGETISIELELEP